MGLHVREMNNDELGNSMCEYYLLLSTQLGKTSQFTKDKLAVKDLYRQLANKEDYLDLYFDLLTLEERMQQKGLPFSQPNQLKNFSDIFDEIPDDKEKEQDKEEDGEHYEDDIEHELSQEL